jgi:hypothetical protein
MPTSLYCCLPGLALPVPEVGIAGKPDPSSVTFRKEIVMADSVWCTGPLAVHMDSLHDWLGRSGCSPGRSVRCEHAFARFSSWMARRHLELADLDGDLIGEYVGQEQERTGGRTPAAFQYLPIARRYLVAAGVMGPAAPVGRCRDGVPRLLAGRWRAWSRRW